MEDGEEYQIGESGHGNRCPQVVEKGMRFFGVFHVGPTLASGSQTEI